ncbi:MAG TPA: efflux RND transporter periplasmic adaptor subunit [Cyclobacteriaceae bacterium]
MKSTIYTRLGATVIIAALLAGCSAKSSDDKAAHLKELKAQQEKLTKEIAALEEIVAKENPDKKEIKSKDVEAVEVKPGKFDQYVQTQGAIESEENILVSAKTAGLVSQVFATEGHPVSKGQVIAQIDNSLMVRGIEELKSQLELSKTIYDRQKNLWDQKIGTEVQFLQAKTNKESMERRLASLQEQNDMTRIKSPINGTIDAVNVKVGENIAPGMPAFRVVNTSNLKVTAKISEAYVSVVNKGDKVVISIPELDKEINATVTFVGKNIDLLSRTFPIEIKVPSSANLRPNMTVVIKVIFNTNLKAITVPVNVVQTINNEKVVYVAETNGKNTVARKRVVEVDGVYDDKANIKSGLAAGEKVITIGFQGLSDGDFIKL